MSTLCVNTIDGLCNIKYTSGLRCCALGSLVEGGYLFAKQGGLAWIVACSSREVSRTWYCRAHAVTVAEASNACGDWFIPSRTDLLLGHDCKSFWDSFSSTCYWSDTSYNARRAWYVGLNNGTVNIGYDSCKSYVKCVRAFRRVSY
jgi:hypothetical protein